MSFNDWMSRWLRRHQMKSLPEEERARYTAEVMANVKALASAAGTPAAEFRARPVLGLWPRLWVAAATALATGMLIVGLHRPSPEVALIRDAQQLAQIEHLLPEAAEEEDLSQELELMDTMMLAEADTSQDEVWIEQTLQLLEQTEELPEDNADSEESDDSWMNELELLDESQLTRS